MSSAANSQCWLVRMEFGRIQTFLFSVPELKSMVGANTLMGEILRGRLIDSGAGRRAFAQRVQGLDAQPVDGQTPPDQTDNLPALAVACGACLPNGVRLTELKLPDAVPIGRRDWDDPAAAYAQGILARDGGHLNAVFPDEGAASDFVVRAQDLVCRYLPGLEVSCQAFRLQQGDDGRWRYAGSSTADATSQHYPAPTPLTDRSGRTVPRSAGRRQPPYLPQFQVCEVTGLGAASAEVRTPDGARQRVSQAVEQRRRAAERFAQGKSSDLLGLLRESMLGQLGIDAAGSHRVDFPTEFNRLAPSGYMAVIAADGNNVGGRAREIFQRAIDQQGDVFGTEAELESFHHRNRCTVRGAVLQAIGEAFRGHVQEKLKRQATVSLPFRFLMLGGDDLVMVCDAVFGPAFLVAYARALEQAGVDLTVGAGMAIVKHAFPFYRAHELAEQLQSSAKRLYRAGNPAGGATRDDSPRCDGAIGSTVDWLAISEAWHDDLAKVRREQHTVRYRRKPNSATDGVTLMLSGKPYPILGGRGQQGLSLEQLVAQARKAVASGPARTQLNALASQLPKGQWQAEWAVLATRDERLDGLLTALHGKPSPWRCVAANGSQYLSHLLDFMELFELVRRQAAYENEALA